jgi:hypothetical protein
VLEKIAKGLASRLSLRGPDLSQFAVKLEDPAQTVSETFPNAGENYLHVIVQGQSAREC